MIIDSDKNNDVEVKLLNMGVVQVKAPFPLLPILKSITGARWNPTIKAWVFPENSIIELIEKVAFTPNEDIRELITKLNSRAIWLNNVKQGHGFISRHKFLMPHQSNCVAIAQRYNRFAFFLDTGTGKTITALEIIKQHDKRTIIIAPKVLIKAAWLEDAQNWYTDMRIYPLSLNMRLEDLQGLYVQWGMKLPYRGIDGLKSLLMANAQHYIINPESFKIQIQDIEKLEIDMLIVDESTILKNSQSLISKAVHKYAKTMQHVYILSGLPAPRSISDYFAQMLLIDDSILGTSFYSFRAKYFHSTDRNGWNWEPNVGAENKIAQQIAKYSYVLKKEDCIALPERNTITLMVELDTKTKKIIKEITKDMMLALTETNNLLCSNAAALVHKLRQLAGGYLIDNDKIVHHYNTAKMDTLCSIMDTLGEKPIVIWAQYRHEVHGIYKALTEKGYTVTDAYGGSKNIDDNIKIFLSGEAQVIICHPASVKYGVTLINSCTAIYYSMGYDYNEFYQSQDRIYRKGQKEHCTYYRLVARGTIDEICWETVENKHSSTVFIDSLLRLGN